MRLLPGTAAAINDRAKRNARPRAPDIVGEVSPVAEICRLVHGIDPDHGVLRPSFVHYTHPDEVERAISALEATL